MPIWVHVCGGSTHDINTSSCGVMVALLMVKRTHMFLSVSLGISAKNV